MNSAVFYSSKTDMWATPQDFFDALDAEFHFTLDACAVKENSKCAAYYTPEQNGLDQPWTGQVWCNPPYGRNVGQWVKKAHDTASGGGFVVMLLPARTDTRWFHDYIYGKTEVRFIKGRLKFGSCQNAAPFPSMVVIFGGEHKNE